MAKYLRKMLPLSNNRQMPMLPMLAVLRHLPVLILPMLSGCALQSAVVHDGLEARVVDADTKRPLPGAFVYDSVKAQIPQVLASSDAAGTIALEPVTRLTLAFPTAEAMIYQGIWVCKEGYVPVRVGGRFGWNADYARSEIYRPGTIELVRSKLDAAASCANIK